MTTHRLTRRHGRNMATNSFCDTLKTLSKHYIKNSVKSKKWKRREPLNFLYSISGHRNVFFASKNCPRFLQEREKYYEKFTTDNAEQLEVITSYLSKNLNSSFCEPSLFRCAWDTFISEEFEGYILPAWTKEIFPQPMEDLYAKCFISLHAPTDQVVRLVVGALSQQMMNAMRSKANGTLSPDKKMHYYSAHDLTLTNLQLALGVPRSDIGIIKPSSCIIFELHQTPSSEYTVQILFIDGASPSLDPVALHVPGCPHPCDLTRLANITSKFENVDYDEECKPTIDN